MALGEQVTPTEYRSLYSPRAIERTLLRSDENSASVSGLDSRSFRTVSHEVGMRETWIRSAGLVVICSTAFIDAIFAPLRNRRFSQ
jgi:hypothetical protein